MVTHQKQYQYYRLKLCIEVMLVALFEDSLAIRFCVISRDLSTERYIRHQAQSTMNTTGIPSYNDMYVTDTKPTHKSTESCSFIVHVKSNQR